MLKEELKIRIWNDSVTTLLQNATREHRGLCRINTEKESSINFEQKKNDREETPSLIG
jgi:hypothetical protein